MLLCLLCLATAVLPEQVHLARTKDPAVNVATWIVQIDVAHSPDGICQFGPTRGGPYNSTTANGAYTYTEGGFDGSIYTATLGGLTPSTRYFYKCGHAGSMSAEFTFLSAPVVGTQDTQDFLIWGDMGASEKGRPIGEDSSYTQAALAKDAATGVYSLCLNVGDTSYADDYAGNNSHVEDRYYREMEATIANVPMMLVVGNHDVQYDYAAINNRTSMPVVGAGALRRFYYSFDHGPAHIVVYSTEVSTKKNSEQWTFVKHDLESVDRKKTPWVIAITHHAFYCSDEIYRAGRCGTQSLQFREELEDVFKDNQLDLHFAGHNHMAEMSFPMYQAQPVQKDFNKPTAPIYVVQGAAGDKEGNEPLWFDVPWRSWHGVGFQTMYSRLALNHTHAILDFVVSKTRKTLHRATITK